MDWYYSCCWCHVFFFYTVHVIVTRATNISIHWLQLEFYTATVATWLLTPIIGMCYFIANYVMWKDATRAILSVYNPWIPYIDWIQMAALGVVGTLASAAFTRSIQLQDVRWPSIIMYIQVPLQYIGQVLLFHLNSNVITWIGAGVVLMAVLIPPLRQIYIESKRNNNE